MHDRFRRAALGCVALALLTAPATVARAVDRMVTAQPAGPDHSERGGKRFYPEDKFPLEALPDYKPAHTGLVGTLRIWGSPYVREAYLMDYWEQGFRKYFPGIKFEYHLTDSLTALGGVYTGAGDIGVGPRLTWNDNSAFIHTYPYDPTEIMVATGSYDVLGWNPAFGVFVNSGNPLGQLTMKQLDGIFGSARNGGWIGFDWHPEFARGPDGNIRTWGQLGLTGEWAGKPIEVHWLNLRYHMSETISNRVLKGSDQWNEKVHMYANTTFPDGSKLIASEKIVHEVERDPYAITISSARWANPKIKALPLSEGDNGPFVPFTIENVQNRSYPLADEVYMYANRDPKAPMDPKVQEFLRYVVSRQGQQDVIHDGKYLPLTGALSGEQLKKLD